ncbi:MAG: hypothetical protein M0C28_21595 [Candidatus Moduliflexus flocculans]|nr:hypothetical protein [Candidatus Moduliflexus flocculans]
MLALVHLNLLVSLMTLAAVIGYLYPYTLAQTHLALRCHTWRDTRRLPGSDRLRRCQPDHRAGWADAVLFVLWQPPFPGTLAVYYQEGLPGCRTAGLPAAKGEHYTKNFILLYARCRLFPLSLLPWFFSYCSAGFAAALLTGGIFLASLIRFPLKAPLSSGLRTNGYFDGYPSHSGRYLSCFVVAQADSSSLSKTVLSLSFKGKSKIWYRYRLWHPRPATDLESLAFMLEVPKWIGKGNPHRSRDREVRWSKWDCSAKQPTTPA